MCFKSSLTLPAVAAISFCLIGSTVPAPADVVDISADDADLIYTNSKTSGWFGHSVAGAGDVNNDGYKDFIVGAYSGGSGFARVYSGTDGSLLYEFTGEGVGDQFGECVAGAGDVDNDGFADLIIGAPNNDTNGPGAGRAYVMSGQTGAILHIFDGLAPVDRFGESVAGAGDIDGDGYNDVIVGAPGNDTAGNIAGQAYIFSGRNGDLIYTFTPTRPFGQLGSAVAGAGDVDDDGFPDVIVGAVFSDFHGEAFVYSGRTGALLYTLVPEPSYVGFSSRFGEAVAGAGDVNGDGFDDLIVGATTHTPREGPTEAGSIFVFCGLDGGQLYRITGEGAYDDFGQSVSSVGDIDGDGNADLLVGARLNDADTGDFSDNTGRAYIFSGSNAAMLYRFTGQAPDSTFGESVALAGDVNNDGVPDVIVGAPRHNNVWGSAYVFFMDGDSANPGDLDGDGSVGASDLLILLANWGPCGDCDDCPADLNGDCTVGAADLLILLANWG